ncbi:MAG: HAMP domain-containing sensor histidine kinase, partial [Gemmatimonadaceae bacterium]
QLAGAADRLAAGDFAAPLPTPAVWEVARTTRAFAEMRAALAARLSELRAANTELEDRAARLTSLQAELIQRDRLAASGRLVAQLAHEIRNPVANLRNCLELLHRRLADDPEGREFADLAIDELLRMHELAEQMLDLNRPRESGARVCDVAAVAREVAALATAGAQAGEFRITVTGLPAAAAAIAPDACKQILINLVQNAREAMTRSSVAGGGATNATNAMNATTTSARAGGHAEIAVGRENGIVTLLVRDDGPGFAPDVLPRVFDPFFTTKAAVRGVGLGLFVAEGLVRTAGGRIAASNAPGGGAEIRVELPAAADTGATE